MKRYALLAVLALALSLPLASSAPADDSPDEAAQNRARELFERGESALANTPPDYDAACEAFRNSFAVAHGLGALKKEAVCEEARGRLATALALWNQAVAMPQDDTRKADASKQIAALESRVGRLRVDAPSSGARLSLSVDGGPWPLGEAKPIDAGPHKVVFEGTDAGGSRSSQTVEVTVVNGMTATAHPPEPHDEHRAPTAEPAPSAHDSRSTLRIAGFTVGGVGAAGIIAFGITGGLVLSTEGSLRDACRNHATTPYSGCNADAQSLADKGSALNVANAVSLGLGVVGVGVAIPLLVFGYKDAPRTSALVLPWFDQRSAGVVVGGGF